MAWSPAAVAVKFRDVSQRHFFSFILYTLIRLVRYTEVEYQLKQSFFFMRHKFDKLLSEIDNVLQKGEFNLTMSA